MSVSDNLLSRVTFTDASGKLTREAIRFLMALAGAANGVTNIENTTAMQGQASAFDDVPQRDVSAELVNALLARVDDTPRVAVDAAASLDYTTSPVAPADPLATLGFIERPSPVVPDPLASNSLFDTPTPAPLDALAGIALFETGAAASVLSQLGSAAYQPSSAFDAAGAANTAVSNAFPGFASFTPVLSAGSMTISGLSITSAEYCTFGNFCYITLWVTFTTSGTATATISVSLPQSHSGALNNLSASVNLPSAGYWSSAFAYINGSSISVNPGNAANWPLGSIQLIISGLYRIK